MPAAGLPADGNPLKLIDGPVVVVTLLTTVAVTVVSVEPVEEPRFAIVCIGVVNELLVHVVEAFTRAVFVTPVKIFLIVPFE